MFYSGDILATVYFDVFVFDILSRGSVILASIAFVLRAWLLGLSGYSLDIIMDLRREGYGLLAVGRGLLLDCKIL